MKPPEITLDFDSNDFKNLGRPKFFDPDNYLDLVEQMICADELERAFWMLDNMPGWFRTNVPSRAIELRETLHKLIWNIGSYVGDEAECYEASLNYQKNLHPDQDWDGLGLGAMIDIGFCNPRGKITIDVIRDLNQKGMTPFIWEMGSANFWLPYGLHTKGCKFTYCGSTINQAAMNDHRPRLEALGVWQDRPTEGQTEIFVCFETIEHLWREADIIHQYHRFGAKADYILMSTPLGTLLGGVNDYHRELGHLRTYTPTDLFQIGSKFWPGFDWSLAEHHMMVLLGTRRKPETEDLLSLKAIDNDLISGVST